MGTAHLVVTSKRVLSEYNKDLIKKNSLFFHTGTVSSLFQNCYRTSAHEKFYVIEDELMNL